MAVATLERPPAVGGKEARARVPRSSHGEWVPAANRRDPVAILEQQAKTRVAELVPIRYGRMLVSPSTFYRGAAALMAADLAGTPDIGVAVQLCGDAHLSNFGVYRAPDRRLIFDLNDFDETHVGPWEWDVKRLVASLEIASRDRGFSLRRRDAIVRDGVGAYREAMREFAAMGNLAVWYSRLDVEDFLAAASADLSRAARRDAQRSAARALRKDSSRALARLATRVDGRLQFRSDPPLLTRAADLVGNGAADLSAWVEELLGVYRATLPGPVRHLSHSYRPVDVARKVVGVGSVGTRAWVVLLEGRDDGDPLVLQAKEAQASVLEAHLGKSGYRNHGERVVHGQRFMQAASDVLLGWLRATGIDGVKRDFYVRQLWDGKGGVTVETMPADRMAGYARLCGWTLARAHARSGDRAAIAGYLGGGERFDHALLAFARRYADQNEQDFRALERAVEDGRIAATPGV